MNTHQITRKRIAAILLGVLIPITALTIAYGQRFRRMPAWSRDLYPYVLWPLVALTLLVALIYLILYIIDTRLR